MSITQIYLAVVEHERAYGYGAIFVNFPAALKFEADGPVEKPVYPKSGAMTYKHGAIHHARGDWPLALMVAAHTAMIQAEHASQTIVHTSHDLLATVASGPSGEQASQVFQQLLATIDHKARLGASVVWREADPAHFNYQQAVTRARRTAADYARRIGL